jgi:hypothetical protein
MATKNFLWFIMLWTLDKFSAAQLIWRRIWDKVELIQEIYVCTII